MRVEPGEVKPRRVRRLRRWVVAVLVVVVFLFLSAQGIAGVYTDYLWFDSVGFVKIWRGLLWARFVPAAVFTVFFFLMMYMSLAIADRIAPRTRGLGPEDEMLAKYQNSVAPYAGRIRIALSAFFALLAGGTVSGQWQEWILFMNAQDFGIKDPQFHMDVGFYVFRLPFLAFIFDWLFAALLIIFVVTALVDYLNGGIRIQTPFQRVTPQVKGHLSVILALMALVKTGQYYLARYELNFSTRGVVEGASKTDIAAELPALNLLMVISVVAAVLFVWNIWRRGWVLPIIAVGLWAFVSLVIGTVVPTIYQQFFVNPNELQKERPYITRNIDATREAFDLDQVQTQAFDYSEDLTSKDLLENAQTIGNTRLWDPGVILRDYQLFQTFQTFYRFSDADVDRYEIDGTLRQVLIAARELNRDDLPSQSWLNRHIVYTHGYGAAVSPANDADNDGLPSYLLEEIPATGEIPLDVPEIYFGENLEGYSLVDAVEDEFNYERSGQRNATTRYDGSGGVEMSSWARRAAFALRFSDFNLVISGQITPKTKVMYLRSIQERVQMAAPFLSFDQDPYPVIVEGRIVWVLDGFTTSNWYPYSQSFSGSHGLAGAFNYVRNSVKVTVDAYDGTTTFYVVDKEDPIIKAYRQAFPDLFTSFGKMPAAVREHLRYPQDLFRSQTDVYSRYHVTDPTTFFQGSDLWEISPDPGSGPLDVAGFTDIPAAETTGPQAATSTSARMEPLYVLIKLPGEDTAEFVLIRPFVPVSKGNALGNLRAFMTAKSRPDAKKPLFSFQMPSGRGVFGPMQVNSTINNTDDISAQFTLLNDSGSSVWQGSLQLVPVKQSLLYIRPIYVVSENGDQPAFRFVVVFYAGKAVIAQTVEEALGQFPQFKAIGPPDDGGKVEPIVPGDETVNSLLRQATEAFQAAQNALKAGALGEYQTQVTKIGELLERAANLGSKGTEPSTPTTTTSSATRSSAMQR